MKRFKNTITWLLGNTKKMNSEKVQEVSEELLAQEVQAQEVLYLSTKKCSKVHYSNIVIKTAFYHLMKNN